MRRLLAAIAALAISASAVADPIGIPPGGLVDNGVTEPKLKAVDTAADEECLTYEVGGGGDFEWQPCAAADGLGPDGDKGDITVGGSGTSLQIDPEAIVGSHLATGIEVPGYTVHEPAMAVKSPSMVFTVPSIDDPVGIADGEGADPNPAPWSTAVEIQQMVRQTVFGGPNSYSVDPLHYLHLLNGPPGSAGQNQNMHTAMFYVESCFDASQRSPRCLWELNLDIQQSTHLINWTGRSNTIELGTLLTFSDGVRCKPLNQYTAGATTSNRFQCEDGIAPAAGSTIASCIGPSDAVTACSPSPAGTVSGTPVDEGTGTILRPFSLVWENATDQVHFGIYWRDNFPALITDGSFNGIYLGRNAAGTSVGSVLLPATTTVGDNFLTAAGNIGVDTSNASTSAGALVFSDGTPRALNPNRSIPIQLTLVSDLTDLVNVDLGFHQAVTIKAAACQNMNRGGSGHAQFSLQTYAGAAIDFAATLQCVGRGTTLSWVSTTDPDASLGSGSGVRVSTENTPTNNGTETYTLYLAVQDTVL